MHATCSTHVILLDLIILIIAEEEYYEVLHYSLFQLPSTSSLLGPNNLLSTPPPNTFSLLSPLSVRDQLFTPTNKTGKIIIVYHSL
jgi:hypothetical protein